jgi:hypothetical protein
MALMVVNFAVRPMPSAQPLSAEPAIVLTVSGVPHNDHR